MGEKKKGDCGRQIRGKTALQCRQNEDLMMGLKEAEATKHRSM
jgi:hypothetical protein